MKTEVIQPIKEAKWGLTRVMLYPNRLEIEEKTLLFGTKRETILLRNVSSVEKKIGSRLFVITNDHKRHPIPILGDWDAWQDAIVNAL